MEEVSRTEQTAKAEIRGDHWLDNVVETIASEYGWTRDYILDRIYPDEAMLYLKKIKERRISDYLMHAQISLNPYTKKPERLLKALKRQLGTQVAGETLDRKGLTKLKSQLKGQGSKVIVK